MNKRYSAWYESLYPQLSGYGLWLRGNEPNTLAGDEFDKRFFKILFVRLSTYRDTVHSTTLKVLYGIAGAIIDVYPDMAFLPPPADGVLFTEHQVPWMLGVQSKCGPEAFDVVALSNATILELVNVPVMLARSGIALRKSERLENPTVPLMVIGGSNALAMSALYTGDPVVDGIFAGGDPRRIRELVERCRDGKRQGLTKREILQTLRSIPGFIEPEAPAPTVMSYADTVTDFWVDALPVFYLEENPGTGHVPITHGCPYSCSFCFESWGNKPWHAVTAETVIPAALRAKATQGIDSIELYSFNFNTHPQVYTLVWELVGLFRTIGLKSQRFDILARDPEMMKLLHCIQKTSLTCGLEGISSRIRNYLNKNLSEEHLHRSVALILRSPMRELKIFLIVTGHEEENDFEEFNKFVSFIARTQASLQRKIRIIFSLTPLVRFPWTPLEFDDGFAPEHYAPIIRKITGIAHGKGFECRNAAEVTEYWLSQVLARAGNERIGNSLIKTVEKTGFVYYEEVPWRFIEEFVTCCSEAGILPMDLIRGSHPGDIKPWRSIDIGVDRSLLWKHYQSAIDALENRNREINNSSGKIDALSPLEKSSIVLGKSPYSILQLKERMTRIRSREKSIFIQVDFSTRARGIPRSVMATVLAHALLSIAPELSTFYRGYRGSHWDHGGFCWIIGADRMELVWLDEGHDKLARLLDTEDFINNVNKNMEDWGSIKGPAPAEGCFYSLDFHTDFPFNIDGYLSEKHLKYTRVKTGSNQYRFNLNQESMKKKIVQSVELKMIEQNRICVSVIPSEQFEPEEFAGKSFILPKSSDWVKVVICSRYEK